MVRMKHVREHEREICHQQIEALINPALVTVASATSTPSFLASDPTTKLWKDYQARLDTFTGANSSLKANLAPVFLTNRTAAIHKLLGTLAGQQDLLKHIHDLIMEGTSEFTKASTIPNNLRCVSDSSSG